jgi:hypothetical protein
VIVLEILPDYRAGEDFCSTNDSPLNRRHSKRYRANAAGGGEVRCELIFLCFFGLRLQWRQAADAVLVRGIGRKIYSAVESREKILR